MKFPKWTWAVVAAAAILTVGYLESTQVRSQAAKPVATNNDTPRRSDGKPDLNGVWTERFDGTDTLPGQVDEKGSVDAVLRSRTGGLYAAEIDGHVIATDLCTNRSTGRRYAIWNSIRCRKILNSSVSRGACPASVSRNRSCSRIIKSCCSTPGGPRSPTSIA